MANFAGTVSGSMKANAQKLQLPCKLIKCDPTQANEAEVGLRSNNQIDILFAMYSK